MEGVLLASLVTCSSGICLKVAAACCSQCCAVCVSVALCVRAERAFTGLEWRGGGCLLLQGTVAACCGGFHVHVCPVHACGADEQPQRVCVS